MSISLNPKKARVISGYDAWWYDDKRNIHVLIQQDNKTNPVSCTIKRSELLKYIKRTST